MLPTRDTDAADVTKYVGYLKNRHDAELAKVGGGQKLYDYGFSVNGFAAKLSYESYDGAYGLRGKPAQRSYLARTRFWVSVFARSERPQEPS